MTEAPFLFERYTFDDITGILRLFYRYEDGPSFEEKIVFPPATRALSDADKKGFG